MVLDFVRFSAASMLKVLLVFSLKMSLEIWSISEKDVKFHEESIYDGLRRVG